MKIIAALVVTAAFATTAQAGYIVTGPMEGQVCSGFVIKSCSRKTVAAVQNSSGGLSEVTKYFNQVTEHNPATGRCVVRIKSKSDSLISAGIDAIRNPTFYERTGSEYQKIDVEYLTFNCRSE